MSNSTLRLCRNNSKLHLSHSSFQRYAQQLLCLNSKLHWQLVEHVLGIAVDDKAYSLLGRDATLVAVEQLVFLNLGCCSLVLNNSRVVVDIHVGESVCSAVGTKQQRVA